LGDDDVASDDDLGDDDVAGDDDDSTDSDGDALPDGFENDIGTDPFDPDSDGDGFDDGTEYEQHFFPWDGQDHPYTGDYPRQAIPWEGVSGQGWDQGDISLSWSAEDQWGEFLHLERFYGNVILIEMGAEWCGPCREAAATAESEYQIRRAQGFVTIQLLLDGIEGGEPLPMRWADDFNLTLPIIPDHQQAVSQHYIVDDGSGSFGIPNFTILDRELRVVSKYGYQDWGLIDALLDEPMPTDPWPQP
jgi:thiol-disulfide isomerase/thioredoxin